MQIKLKVKLLPKLVGQGDKAPVRMLMPGDVVDYPDADATKLITLGHATAVNPEPLPAKGS